MTGKVLTAGADLGMGTICTLDPATGLLTPLEGWSAWTAADETTFVAFTQQLIGSLSMTLAISPSATVPVLPPVEPYDGHAADLATLFLGG